MLIFFDVMHSLLTCRNVAATINICHKMSEFAAAHMKRHGWAKGKGLGRDGNGISEPIKVSMKADSTGVGHDSSKQFTFHWWEHAFETASKNIKVKEEEDGVVLTAVDTCITTATNKIYKKSLTAKSMLYGRFVKSGVLNNGLIEKSDCSDSEDSTDEEDNHRPLTKDLQMLTDEDLFNACGGRTAHKGARHGMKLSGKLARLAEQEIVPEAAQTPPKQSKTTKKKKKHQMANQNLSTGIICAANDNGVLPESDDTKIDVDGGKTKKSEKRKNGTSKNVEQITNVNTQNVAKSCKTDEPVVTKKKKRKRKVEEEVFAEQITLADANGDEGGKSKKKKKRKREVK